MKKISLFLLSIMAVMSSCDKEDEPNRIEISNQEAAIMIGTSLGQGEAGLGGFISETVLVVDEVTDGATGGRQSFCGTSDEITLSISSQQGDPQAYSFDYVYGWSLSCDANSQPSILAVNVSFTGNLNSPQYVVDYTGSSEMTISDIMQDVITFNGGHLQNGVGTVTNEGQTYRASQQFSYVLKDVKVSRTTNSIQSGTATVQVSGTSDEGVLSITASVTYNGDGTATVVVNNETFEVDVYSGTLIG